MTFGAAADFTETRSDIEMKREKRTRERESEIRTKQQCFSFFLLGGKLMVTVVVLCISMPAHALVCVPPRGVWENQGQNFILL